MDGLTIGQLARRAGVNVETLRYYERRALLPSPPRTPSGYRQYAPDAVRRIGFIKRAQQLGFTLHEIGELLALRIDPDANCDAVERQAEHAITRIDDKIAELQRMRSALGSLVTACHTRRPTDDCPILDALELEANDHGHHD
jgi:Hg(II)-responsive transcriptional regulator